MNTLLVDAGNHSIKWATLTDDGLVGHKSVSWTSNKSFVLMMKDIDPIPDRVVVSNVAGNQARDAIERAALECWNLVPQFIQSTDACCGVVNGYIDPAKLGVDRWLAMIAARSLTSGAVIVVDCGTAITIDLLDHEGQFRGGVIMAGLALSQAALSHGTSALASYESDTLTCVANTTADAVTSGAMIGMAGAIERVIHEQSGLLETPPAILLAGGDAAILLPLLHVDAEIHPDLVLHGLRVWVESM